MGAALNKSVAANGVVAYQDHLDANKFHYLVQRIDAVLGETLRDFSVVYWGINKEQYFVDMGNNKYESSVGGVLSGMAIPDMTDAQKSDISKEITKMFGIKTPNLTPLVVTKTKVQPVFASNLVEDGKGSSTVFPEIVQFGSQFSYNVSSNKSLFSEMVARMSDKQQSTEFGVNISGEAEFYGDPWSATIECDLSQVWKHVRSNFSASVSTMFASINTDLQHITQELIKNNVIKITYHEGSGESEFARQLFEMMKSIFEALNAKMMAGEGLFRFEPNPSPSQPPDKKSWGASLLPWRASINLSYGSESFKQSMHHRNDLKYTGKIMLSVASAMSLAVHCTPGTREYFEDLQMGEIGCVTAKKKDGLQSRIQKENSARDKKLQQYFKYVEDGKWTVEQFGKMYSLLNKMCLTCGSSQEDIERQFQEFERTIDAETAASELIQGQYTNVCVVDSKSSEVLLSNGTGTLRDTGVFSCSPFSVQSKPTVANSYTITATDPVGKGFKRLMRCAYSGATSDFKDA